MIPLAEMRSSTVAVMRVGEKINPVQIEMIYDSRNLLITTENSLP